MRCEKCFAELKSPTSYCLNCGHRNALGGGIFADERRIYLFFVGKDREESHAFRLYEEEESIRNVFEVIAERIHEKRLEEIFVSGKSEDLIDLASEMVKRVALTPLTVCLTEPFESPKDFFEHLVKHLRTVRELKKVDIKPEDKIHGAHSTVIGGREGMKFLQRIARSEFVKKIIPGVIEAKGTAVGGGVRFKLTRCDDRGNIRALLIDGSSVQEIHIVTTARNKEEGEVVLKILRGLIEEE